MSVLLNDPPQELISSTRFSLVSDRLLVSSWDSTLRVYDVKANRQLSLASFNASLLDSCWEAPGESIAYTAGLERRIYRVDIETGQKQVIGFDHRQLVKSLCYDSSSRSIISGSCDKTLQQIDAREGASGNSRFADLPDKVFALDSVNNMLVVGMAKRNFHIYDLRKLNEPLQRRESSLKFPTRTVKCFPDGLGYITTSIEGRVAVEFFDPSPEAQAQKYAFKSHKIVDKAYKEVCTTPINAVAFHPRYGTFFTGGSDSIVCLWDLKAKKRLKQYQKLPQAVVTLDVNSSGSTLAIGTSDDSFVSNPIEEGPRPIKAELYIRYLGDDEGKSKM
jgi:cell cycle arrest protein BUB3